MGCETIAELEAKGQRGLLEWEEVRQREGERGRTEAGTLARQGDFWVTGRAGQLTLH